MFKERLKIRYHSSTFLHIFLGMPLVYQAMHPEYLEKSWRQRFHHMPLKAVSCWASTRVKIFLVILLVYERYFENTFVPCLLLLYCCTKRLGYDDLNPHLIEGERIWMLHLYTGNQVSPHMRHSGLKLWQIPKLWHRTQMLKCDFKKIVSWNEFSLIIFFNFRSSIRVRCYGEAFVEIFQNFTHKWG